ncbi:MAG: hypothetical protein GXP26_18250 [Planctomycetes bacterium]|nr:hypothetical protein [Planctomycetota bacterium]
MGGIHESVRTFNSTLRTLIFSVLVGGAGVAGWQGYSLYNEPQQQLAAKQDELDSLRVDLAAREQELLGLGEELDAKNQQLDRARTSLRLLKLSHRIARFRVLDQVENEETGRKLTTIEFYEVNNEGAPIDDRRKKFEIEGEHIYVECLVAKFDDKYIERADLDRSTAICLFQRIFGEYQQPQEGYQLDEMGSSPTSYARGGQISEFEQKIWDDFWNIASDRKKAAELGIRAAHAIAPSTRVKKGVTYELELRSTGEFSLVPISGNTPG